MPRQCAHSLLPTLPRNYFIRKKSQGPSRPSSPNLSSGLPGFIQSFPPTCSRSSSNNPMTSPRPPSQGSTSTLILSMEAALPQSAPTLGWGVPPPAHSRPPGLLHHRHKARAAHTTGSAVCFLRLDNQFSLGGRSQDTGKPNGHQPTQQPGPYQEMA